VIPSRWQQVEELYHAALECEPGERAAFLERYDPELRREVESLLAQGRGATPLDHPAWEGAGSLLKSTVAALSPGTQLGPYRIEGPLAAGGMGEVFRATDTRLGRPVAVKTSRERFSARFDREARAISSLNHPHICTLYDVGPNYLVMELCEGETLAARLKRGKLSIQETVRYGAQIADALAAAHAKGITHRDLKPGNIMLVKVGVKVLDFGLAKSPQDETLTGTRMVMGTPAYMAPEQRDGKDCDARTDMYSLGLVLYEMATGKRAEQGQPPPLDTLSPQLAHVIERCLAQDPDDRWQSARDLQRELQWASNSTLPLEGADQPGARRPWLAWTVAAVLALGLAVIAFLHFREPASAPNAMPELALSIIPPSGLLLPPIGGLSIDRISPNGSTVLYRASDGRFHIRKLSSLQDQLTPPLDWYGDPFWAPDSKSIGFPTLNGLMKLQVPNGAPELVAAPFPNRGSTWSDKGMIVFAGYDASPGGVSLYGVPVSGGKAIPIAVPGLKEGRYYNPEFLPGGEDFLFVFSPSSSEGAQIFIATMRDGKAVDPRMLFSNDTSAAFTGAGGGHILFVRNDNLYAQKFDVSGRRLIGDPELVQERVASNAAYRNAYFSVSSTGTVVWRSGTAVTSQVTVFDRKGNRIGTAGSAVAASLISLAPDEAHVLVSDEAGSWIMESNGPGRTSLVWSALPRFWSPDGSGIIGRRGTEIVQRSISDSQETRLFAELPVSGSRLMLHDISTDGRRILYTEQTSLLLFSLDRESRSQHVVDQRVDNAALSPDGAWAVYRPFTESGIYVQPLASSGLRRQIANSGNRAVWRKDGKEILYDDQGRIWSVRVDGVGTQLHFAPRDLLFSVTGPLGTTSSSRPLAVSRDGLRIYFLQSTEQPDSGVIHVRTRAIR
jgi:serine/threonine protein kinase